METEAIKEKRNQMEIVGIPKIQNENLELTIMELARKAKVDLAKTDIEACYRTNTREGKEGQIVVKFKETKI